MLIVTGESGSGKSTVEQMLKDYGWKPIISYTSRPPRAGERDHISYHFISATEFQQLKSQGFFAETTVYNSWQYGIAKIDLEGRRVAVLEPFGISQLEWQGYKPIIIYIKTTENTRRRRIALRGDNPTEMERRIASDRELFNGIEEKADYIIDNNEDGMDILEQKVDDLVKQLRRQSRK